MNKKIDLNKYLQEIIPSLNKFNFLSGTEGKVYFIDDDFVVKTYFEPIESLEIFEAYFKEIQSFAEKGYSVPKIFSWTFVPSVSGERFYIYVLQERVKGKNLFDFNLSEIHEKYKNFNTKDDFDLMVKNRNDESFGLYIREFILNCLSTNQGLLYLSDLELEKFISTDFNIGVESRFSMPDVQAGNVLFDGERLRIIDNGFLGYDKGFDSENSVKANLMRDMFLLFYNNESVNWLPKFKCAYSEEIKNLKERNLEASFLAMRRFVRKVNQMYRPVLTNVYDYDACKLIADEIFDEKLSREICLEIQRG